ncbi:MAG: prenyltransferase/squalene oxidase repeat-containing protein [Planctomycetota bacterium]
MRTLRSCFVLVLASVPMSAQVPLQLPIVFSLGPPGAVAFHVEFGTGATPADHAEVLARLRSDPDAALRIDARVPCAKVETLLAAAAAKGLERVRFCAKLPDGREGVFTLALPSSDAVPSMTMRLHSKRPGVPMTAAVPLLSRMRTGLATEMAEVFALRVVAPADAPWSVGLAALSTAVSAGVERAIFATEPGRGVEHGTLAIDFETSSIIPVVAHEVALSKPLLAGGAVGCLDRAEDGSLKRGGGRAGGVYGGRRQPPSDEGLALIGVADTGLDWAAARVGEDGSLPDAAGRVDVGATALLVMAMWRGGQAGLGQSPVMRRAIGVLLAQQRHDGTFSTDTQDHALATTAVISCALLAGDPMLTGPAKEGVRALLAMRNDDGGFGRERTLPSDTATTVLASLALLEARFAGVVKGPTTADVAHLERYLGLVQLPDGAVAREVGIASGDFESTSAALCARTWFGQEASLPVVAKGLDYLALHASAKDPLAGYFTTHALSQQGGKDFEDWLAVLTRDVVATAEGAGESSGSWKAIEGYTRERVTLLRVLSLQAAGRHVLLR